MSEKNMVSGVECLWRRNLIATVVILMVVCLKRTSTQVDYSQALIWSTRASNGNPMMEFIYGDPQVYVPDIVNGRNGSFLSFKITTGAPTDYLVLETEYSTSIVFFHCPRFGICATDQFIKRTGENVFVNSVVGFPNQITGISIDWVSRLLFWSDVLYQQICVINENGIYATAFLRCLIETNITSPQDVVVYPEQSFLFWSDLGENPKIERLDLKTDERRILLSNSTLQRPTKLAIDLTTRRLFWLDASASTIGSMDFDGSSVSLWKMSAFSTISTFLLYRNYVFTGSNSENMITIYDRNQQQYMTNITHSGREGQGIYDITMWSQERQPPFGSPCANGNGGCDHMCITINSTSRRCVCSVGFILGTSGTPCITKPLVTNTFLLLWDRVQGNIFQADPETGEVRALAQIKGFSPDLTALIFDPNYRYLYWFNNGDGIIRATALDSGLTQSLPKISNATGITSLAIDSDNQILYYADMTAGIIGRMYLLNRTTEIVLSEPESNPRTIVLDRINKLIYWSDCGLSTIERGSTSNTRVNRSSVAFLLSSCVTTMAIDFQNKVIYWSYENNLIEVANLDGSSRKTFYQDDTAAVFTGLALNSQFLFITDRNKRQIQKLDRTTLQRTNVTGNVFSSPYRLIYYSNDTVKLEEASSSDSPNVTAIVAGTVVGGSVFLIAILVTIGIILFVKKRRTPKKSTQTDSAEADYTSLHHDVNNHEDLPANVTTSVNQSFNNEHQPDLLIGGRHLDGLRPSRSDAMRPTHIERNMAIENLDLRSSPTNEALEHSYDYIIQ